MSQKESLEKLALELLDFLTPEAIDLLAQHHGTNKRVLATELIAMANKSLKRDTGGVDPDITYLYQAKLSAGGQEFSIDFFAPSYATQSEVDSACLSAISNHAGLSIDVQKTKAICL